LGSPGRGASQISQYIPGDCLNHPFVKELAQKYEKMPAQILLRHTIQQGISVIPKSTSPERLRQNINIFDFELSAEDQQKLDSIQERVRFLIFNL
jgi:diketogulonate reductase-like aldo/keto reductase